MGLAGGGLGLQNLSKMARNIFLGTGWLPWMPMKGAIFIVNELDYEQKSLNLV